MRMKVGDAATSGSLAALLYEAVAAVGILGDHDESTVLEACLSLERGADQVVVLVLEEPRARRGLGTASKRPW